MRSSHQPEDFDLENISKGTHRVVDTFEEARALTHDPRVIGPDDDWLIWQRPRGNTTGMAGRVLGGRGPEPFGEVPPGLAAGIRQGEHGEFVDLGTFANHNGEPDHL